MSRLIVTRPDDVPPSRGASGLQSAALLPFDFGRRLDRAVAASNPFYAFSDIFRFCAFSEVQFLNMLESKIDRDLSHTVLVKQENPTISNLLYNQQALDRHRVRIEEMLECLRATHEGSSPWPQPTAAELNDEQRAKAETSLNKLRLDYEYLLARTLAISDKANRGMQVVMNNVMIGESQRAIAQAAGVAKLTRLAFIFIPLSFVCSFFGMNFDQLGSGNLNLWVWVVTSVPIFALSILLMRSDVGELPSRLLALCDKKDLPKLEDTGQEVGSRV
jgi:hypothetical protein